MKPLKNEDPNNEQQDSDNKKIKFTTGLAGKRWAKIDIFRALDSLRCQLKCPSDYQRHGKSDDEQQHHQTHRPIGNLKERKNLTRDLHQQPRHDTVSDRNLVNIPPLQFGKKILWVHG